MGKDNLIRRVRHQKITEVEQILSELPHLIKDPENLDLTASYPIFFIVGCARSGTTLLSQFLAASGSFCYPSNFIARFFYAPYTGSLLQRLFFDLDSKSELFGKGDVHGSFKSFLGKTRSALAPHEFWYFWRRFFHFGEIQKMNESKLKEIDTDTFLRGLYGIQKVFEKPLMLKAMIMNWHLSFLSNVVSNSYFIYIKRDMMFNAQSLIQARKEFYGDVTKWYSFKPPEFEFLKNEDIYGQVAGQVHFTNMAIEQELSKMDSSRVLSISYETFCNNPNFLVKEIKSKTGIILPENETGFEVKNTIQLNSSDWEKLNKAVSAYE